MTTIGPQFGPLASSYAAKDSWRWPFWIGLIVAVIALLPFFFIRETYGPVILARRAKLLRAQNPDVSAYAATELENKGFKDILVVYVARPMRMIVGELMVTLTCFYLAFATGVYCELTMLAGWPHCLD